MISCVPKSIHCRMNDVVIIVGVPSSVLATVGIVVDIVPIKGVSSVVATWLVIREINILNEPSPYLESFIFKKSQELAEMNLIITISTRFQNLNMNSSNSVVKKGNQLLDLLWAIKLLKKALDFGMNLNKNPNK